MPLCSDVNDDVDGNNFYSRIYFLGLTGSNNGQFLYPLPVCTVCCPYGAIRTTLEKLSGAELFTRSDSFLFCDSSNDKTDTLCYVVIESDGEYH